MDSRTMLWGIFVTLPANMLIIYSMVKDIQEELEKKRRYQNSIENLLTESIVIAISDNEKQMLDRLKKIDGVTSDSKYFRDKVLQASS